MSSIEGKRPRRAPLRWFCWNFMRVVLFRIGEQTGGRRRLRLVMRKDPDSKEVPWGENEKDFGKRVQCRWNRWGWSKTLSSVPWQLFITAVGVVRLLSSVFALVESGRWIIACVYDVQLSFCPVLKHGPRSLRSVRGMRRHRSCRSESNCLSQNSGV